MWHIIIVVSENRQIQQWWGLHFREILGRLFCCCERRRGKLACFQTVKRTRTRKTWNDGKWHTAEIALETAKKIVFWNKTRNCPENYSVLRKNFSSEVLFKLAGSQTSILCTACILVFVFLNLDCNSKWANQYLHTTLSFTTSSHITLSNTTSPQGHPSVCWCLSLMRELEFLQQSGWLPPPATTHLLQAKNF